MSQKRFPLITLIPMIALSLTGCLHHHFAFTEDDTSWHYPIADEPIAVPLNIRVDEASRSGDHEIYSFTAGAANRWHARYGEMFLQALAVEMAQFAPTHTIDAAAPASGAFELDLAIPSYLFENFSATTTVTAVLRSPSGQERLNESYTVIGTSSSGKVVGLGAFGMKSAVRVSTLDAYRRVFEQLRADLHRAISKP